MSQVGKEKWAIKIIGQKHADFSKWRSKTDYSQKITHSNLLQLIQDLQLEGKRFAVEHNHRLILKYKLQHILLQDHDCIEIIHAVGGG